MRKVLKMAILWGGLFRWFGRFTGFLLKFDFFGQGKTKGWNIPSWKLDSSRNAFRTA